MLSFASGLSPNSDAFAIFVTEKYEYKDENNLLSKDVAHKVNLFLKSLKAKNKGEEINSVDISSQKKCSTNFLWIIIFVYIFYFYYETLLFIRDI